MDCLINGDFDLKISADCGQCFRFSTDENGITEGVAGDKYFKGRVLSGRLLCDDGVDAAYFENYFDLAADYAAYVADICKSGDRIIAAAASEAKGLRIFRQDPFEALISFIISQNNNIPRIKGIVERLCEGFGRPFDAGGKTLRAFPTPRDLDGVTAADLAPIRAGFRAGYIEDAVKKWNGGEIDISDMASAPYEECAAALKRIKGVGDKVAACVLLFGFHRLDAFPVDVWIKRTMERFYGDLDHTRFGAYPGLAQQYLFYHSRYLEKISEEK